MDAQCRLRLVCHQIQMDQKMRWSIKNTIQFEHKPVRKTSNNSCTRYAIECFSSIFNMLIENSNMEKYSFYIRSSIPLWQFLWKMKVNLHKAESASGIRLAKNSLSFFNFLIKTDKNQSTWTRIVREWFLRRQRKNQWTGGHDRCSPAFAVCRLCNFK